MSSYRVSASDRLLRPLPARVRGMITLALGEVAAALGTAPRRPTGVLETLPIPGGYGISYLVSHATRSVTLMVVAQPKYQAAQELSA